MGLARSGLAAIKLLLKLGAQITVTDSKPREQIKEAAWLEENGVKLCGTKGWFYEDGNKKTEHDAKILNRELMRLEASLISAGEGEKLVFLHYPPKFGSYECPEILEMLKKYDIKHCYYGHIHSAGCAFAFNGMHNGTQFQLVSADFVKFMPQKII